MEGKDLCSWLKSFAFKIFRILECFIEIVKLSLMWLTVDEKSLFQWADQSETIVEILVEDGKVVNVDTL
ncbi:hypothetical protein PVK06_039016 [Gossypium arboreum]|uniref:Uncharacterized protein n=1 Tax=Gossypium arboreum TaxID=29729 RepID=A0ABR0N1P6_GOSAR|nr:hypothetical protein PVK06_039016 [Gossypium arboreum]